MKTFTQLIEELYESAKVNTALINHHGHEMALARTRNMLNPQLAARTKMKKHVNKLKDLGAEVDKYGGIKHPDPDAHKALTKGMASGRDAENEAQPNYRHDTVRNSSKIRREVGDFTGLSTYRNMTGKYGWGKV
tara:strand:+ start:137 stop:538 length:402 start_codon:yes stop_codon:yes gene_type:complete